MGEVVSGGWRRHKHGVRVTESYIVQVRGVDVGRNYQMAEAIMDDEVYVSAHRRLCTHFDKCAQFVTEKEAEAFITLLRKKHPAWEFEIVILGEVKGVRNPCCWITRCS